MARYGECKVCGANGIVAEHHKIRKSQQLALKKCKKNLIDLCNECHYAIHHGKDGHALDQKLKLEIQNYFEMVFNKQYFSRDEVQEILEINPKATDSLCKTLNQYKGMFSREDIIRACMGGKLVEGEVKK